MARETIAGVKRKCEQRIAKILVERDKDVMRLQKEVKAAQEKGGIDFVEAAHQNDRATAIKKERDAFRDAALGYQQRLMAIADVAQGDEPFPSLGMD